MEFEDLMASRNLQEMKDEVGDTTSPSVKFGAAVQQLMLERGVGGHVCFLSGR